MSRSAMEIIKYSAVEIGMTTGATAAISYGVLERTNQVTIPGGYRMPEWQADTGVAAIGSVSGAVIGEWALPTIDGYVTSMSDNTKMLIERSSKPVATTAIGLGIKKLAVKGSQGTVMEDALLLAGTSLASAFIAPMFAKEF